MANKATTHVMRGTADWAKILGPARKNDSKFSKGNEWTIDITPNAEGRALMKKLGISKKLREPGEKDSRKETFITFRHLELRQDGTKNDPIKVLDAAGRPWPANTLIGNGSTVDVKFRFVDYGDTKGAYIQAVRVLKLVPYEVQEFAPLSEEDEYWAEGASDDDTFAEPDVMSNDDPDDDAPF